MTLRVAFISDLHVEYQLEVVGHLAAAAAQLAPDVLVVAGDVCPDLGRLESCLRLLTRSLRCPVLYLPGNHELWCGGPRGRGPHSRARYERVLPELARRAGAVPLGLKTVLVGPVAFAGVTGWHDGSLVPPPGPGDDFGLGAAPAAGVSAGPARCMDDRQVHWPDPEGRPLDAAGIAAVMGEALRAQLESLADHPGPLVVVTHVLPHPGLLGPAPGPEVAATAPFLGSAALWPIIEGHPRVAQILCGHLHLATRIALPGRHGPIPCEISPVGYPREHEGALEDHVRSRLRLLEIY